MLNFHIPPPDPPIHYCKECNIQLSKGRYGDLCDVCWTLLEVITTPYWRILHGEWIKENPNRAYNRDRLIHGDDHDSNS